MCANSIRVYGLAILRGLFYFLVMVADNDASGGVVGPGIQPPPLSAYAQDLQKKAGSNAASDLKELQAALTSEASLLRLNTAEEYAQLPAQKIALQPILARLARNAAPGAHEIISALSASPAFLAEEVRTECLLQTFPAVRPLPPSALALLRKSVESEEASREIAVRVLFEIGDKPTLEIFSSQVLNPQQDPVILQAWMRDPLLQNRRSPAVLQMSLDLLRNPKLDAELKNSLIEALFDYRPADWYSREAAAPKPPSSTKLSSESRELLKKISAVIAADSAVSAENKALAHKAALASEAKKGDDPR